MMIRPSRSAAWIALAVAALAACLAWPRSAAAQAVFTLKATGGLAYASGGDLNAGLEGRFDLMTAFGAALGYAPQGEFQPAHSSWEGGGDIIFAMTPLLSVSAGVGYIRSAESATRITLTRPGSEPVVLTGEPRVTAIPLRLGLVFSVPLGGRMGLMIQAGGAYYLAEVRADYRQAEGAAWNREEIEAKGGGFGFQGGLGLEIVLTSNVSFVIEGQGRYARLRQFAGTATLSGSSGWTHSEEGTLYYFQNALLPLGSFGALTVSDTFPSGPGTSDVREAEVDLSGVAALAGLLIKF